MRPTLGIKLPCFLFHHPSLTPVGAKIRKFRKGAVVVEDAPLLKWFQSMKYSRGYPPMARFILLNELRRDKQITSWLAS